MAVVALVLAGLTLSGCVSVSDGPERLYPVAVETQAIRDTIPRIDFIEFVRMSEPERFKYRNDWIAARMYASDIQYTVYETGLTKERQNVGFGSTVATLGLTTASQLFTPVVTKNVLSGAAGLVTGTRAAYENDILLAHSVQWIQSQMRTQRSIVAERIFRGMKLSTSSYPLATALTDLEDYYRAGTLTGGILGTSDALGAEARLAELAKQDRVEVTFVSTAAGKALEACVLRVPAGAARKAKLNRLLGLMNEPDAAIAARKFALLRIGQTPAVAEGLLRDATLAGICP
ncbi:hypothetical protein [Bradyrhizobium sp.]|uniref:hypothetical protein n=1 Tax=Bradyrhizobium sp. TaxID=376 RepID=UPI0027348C41|nr:hypothetical protein [Bradyrhizobium sp.]MDP3076816.1 hypothetical protein [Bradyrhizobium sp.]